MQPIAADKFVADASVAAFKSEDIVDGWKHVHRRYWYHPLHQLSSYLGRFPPAIAHYFICKFSQEGEVVYDPFCGSGTVPLEACLLGREAIGNDIFIYAYTLSHAKVRPLNRKEYDDFIAFLKSEVDVRLKREQLDDDPMLPNLQVYYHSETLRQISAMRSVLNDVERDRQHDVALFVKAMLCGILHGDGPMFLSVRTKDTWSASVRYVREYVAKYGLKYERRDVFTCLERKAQRIYAEHLPQKKGNIYKYNITTSKPNLKDASVDLIVTSPPYLSVRDYAYDNWIRVWLLGSDRQTEAKKMLRTSTIVDYELAMKQTLRELYRVLKHNRACIIIAANVTRKVKGLPIYRMTYRLAGLALEVGFNVITIFDDDGINLNRRTSQLFNQKRHPNMVDSVPRDSVLILSKGKCPLYDDTEVVYDCEST